MKIETCPVCETGSVSVSTYVGKFAHRGATIDVPGLRCFRCEACDEITVTGEQARSNQRVVADAKREATNAEGSLFRAEEVREIRSLLGMTQSKAAELFGGGPTAFSKYERGETLPTNAMSRLLWVAAEVPGVVACLEALSRQGAAIAEISHAAWHVANFDYSCGSARSPRTILDDTTEFFTNDARWIPHTGYLETSR